MNDNLIDKIFFYISRIWFLWIFVIVLNIITFLFIFIKIHPGSESLALRYNVLIGVEWFGKGTNLYLLPITGLFLTLGNFILSKNTKEDSFLLPFLPVFVSLVLQIILLTAVIFLSRVN